MPSAVGRRRVEMLTARKIRFDLLITDLRMPFVTGLTVVYSVRKLFPTLPITC